VQLVTEGSGGVALVRGTTSKGHVDDLFEIEI
jgi:glutamate/tyrosine decarboxylase-like PLP-dependent enzyme